MHILLTLYWFQKSLSKTCAPNSCFSHNLIREKITEKLEHIQIQLRKTNINFSTWEATCWTKRTHTLPNYQWGLHRVYGQFLGVHISEDLIWAHQNIHPHQESASAYLFFEELSSLYHTDKLLLHVVWWLLSLRLEGPPHITGAQLPSITDIVYEGWRASSMTSRTTTKDCSLFSHPSSATRASTAVPIG